MGQRYPRGRKDGAWGLMVWLEGSEEARMAAEGLVQ